MVVRLSGTQPQGPKHTESLENKTIDANLNTINIRRGGTAQRPSTPIIGDQYYDTDFNSLYNWNGTQWVRIYTPPPKVDSISPSVSISSGTSITVTGADFTSGSQVSFIGTNGVSYSATSTTFVGSTSLIAITPALATDFEPYDVRVTNPDGQQASKENILDAGSSPTWNTVSGSLGNFYENSSVSFSVSATDPDGTAIVYSSTNLPGGFSLNSSSGLISGTTTTVGTSTTYNFDIIASDGSNSRSRSFSITVNPKATVSGGTVTSDSTYYYRTFTSGTSSLSVSNSSLYADILIVAGGGGTGWDVGGGGGGGGVCYASQYQLVPSSYNVTVGSGGSSLTASPTGGGRGGNGGNSSFGSIIAYGGGGGGSYPTPNGNGTGANGGSGGGGGDANFAGGSSIQTSGAGYIGYGYAGGSSGASWGSAGGGGAGGVGSNGNNSSPVDGGAPYISSISGTSQSYSGGGYGNIDSGTIYQTGYNKSNVYLGYYGFGANGTGAPNGSPYNGNPGVVIVRYLKESALG